MVSSEALSKHQPDRSLSEIKMYPSSQQGFDSDYVEILWDCRKTVRPRQTEEHTEIERWGRKTDRRIERVSRMADCRADRSWYGRSSRQASSVPSRPPWAAKYSHPNISSVALGCHLQSKLSNTFIMWTLLKLQTYDLKHVCKKLGFWPLQSSFYSVFSMPFGIGRVPVRRVSQVCRTPCLCCACFTRALWAESWGSIMKKEFN